MGMLRHTTMCYGIYNLNKIEVWYVMMTRTHCFEEAQQYIAGNIFYLDIFEETVFLTFINN